MSINNRFSQFTHNLRIKSKDLAKIMNVSESSISAIINGRNAPSYESILALAENYKNLNLRWLITGEGEMWEKLSKPYLQEEKPNFSFEPSPAYKASEPTPQAPDILAGLMAAYQEIITLRTENKLLREQINNLTSKGL